MTTGQWSDEALMRACDGELSPDEMARLDAACATDPSLAARWAQFRALDLLAHQAFPVAVDPRDADLTRLIARADSRSTGTTWSDRLKAAFAPRRVAVWGAAAAACFVAGLMIGHWGQPLPSTNGFSVADNGQIADTDLVRVLDQRLAGQGADSDGRSVGLTFRDAEGRWCRTFAAQSGSVAGLACREGDGWALEALARTGDAGGEVRMAASDTPAPVLAAVDALIAGDVLDAANEARVRDGGWR
ncbi:hypothetical protein [uncultured Brevundimonas sp.]|uniref:anti-sigma factor family protein n=1 Tax=uncultured Brevundimonas sp. TaxID=213418 RepID=UPI0025E9E941|nr:hypothetical protein [uncultured Brevundimonas sp.]